VLAPVTEEWVARLNRLAGRPWLSSA